MSKGQFLFGEFLLLLFQDRVPYVTLLPLSPKKGGILIDSTHLISESPSTLPHDHSAKP